MFRYCSFLLITLLLTSCSNNNQPLEGQPISENPLLPLSTTNDNTDPTEENKEITHLDEDGSFAPGFTVPQEEPAKQNKIKEPTVTDNFKLPVGELKERWNAIAAEQGSLLEISAVEKTADNLHKAMIKKDLELQVVSTKNNVKTLSLISRNSSNEAKMSMLEGWSYVVYLMEPNVTPNQIDELFTEFEVGPNLDVHEVKEKTVERNGIQYIVTPLEKGFALNASYINDL